MGVRLKSKAPLSCTYTDNIGFELEGHRRFKGISDCSSRWSQFFIRKLVSVENNPDRKLSLKVLMDLSVVLCW